MSAFHTRRDELLCLCSQKATVQRWRVLELVEQGSPILGMAVIQPGFLTYREVKLALALVKASFYLGGRKTRLDRLDLALQFLHLFKTIRSKSFSFWY